MKKRSRTGCNWHTHLQYKFRVWQTGGNRIRWKHTRWINLFMGIIISASFSGIWINNFLINQGWWASCVFLYLLNITRSVYFLVRNLQYMVSFLKLCCFSVVLRCCYASLGHWDTIFYGQNTQNERQASYPFRRNLIVNKQSAGKSFNISLRLIISDFRDYHSHSCFLTGDQTGK